MKISDKKLLRLINLENKKLSLSKKYILSNKVTIIKNSLKDNIFEDFIKLSKSFGTYLHYDNKPYYKFDETSQQEIGFHTDGVSCLDYKKIPKYLFFYVKDWPQNKKGFFKISSIKKIISKIPENYLSILKKNKLQYLNYSGTLQKFNKSKNFKDVVSFEKYCLRKINGNWTLDMFLPLRKMHKDLKWEYKMKFQNIDLQNSMKILHFLRNISESKDCLCEFPLQSEDIIVINNEKFFHGRNRFTTKVKRSLYKI